MSEGNTIHIGSGATAEIRKIVSINSPGADAAAQQFGGNRLAAPTGTAVIWQPVPEGPVITIPAGSKNIPVTSVAGFKVGQKIAIGYGATYPAVAQATEKYEIVTVTKVDKPGTQAYLATDAKAGSTNIKVSSVANISVGDKIRLDIDSKGHGVETVTVTKVGTQASRSPGRGPFAANEDAGTGLELSAPLKFNHSANIPFSVNGTGISFEPATTVAHSSNEPVLALSSSITLDRPLANNQEINAVVHDEKAKTAGYQGTKAPNQWFGGPALPASAGNMSLRDSHGNVVDGLNYGGLVDPWLAEGYQSVSGSGANGCYVPSPGGMGRGNRPGPASSADQPDRSAGRYPDGYDSDSNCGDFQLQSVTALAIPSEAGANNIKVSGIANFNVGQQCIIGSGVNSEIAVITNIGTAGGTMVATATAAGATTITVSSVAGFEAGQTITIGKGAERETAVIASVTGARRGGNRNNNATESITVTAALKYAHTADAQVSGSGITLAKALSKAHSMGTQVAGSIPTPGAPNQYAKRK